MLSTLVAVAGSLLGVVLGFFAQHLQADLAHRRHLDDLKREAYGELLRAVSASYAQASSGGGTSEDAAILKAAAVIELLSGPEVGSAARHLVNQVSTAHELLRQSGYEAALTEVGAADQKARVDQALQSRSRNQAAVSHLRCPAQQLPANCSSHSGCC